MEPFQTPFMQRAWVALALLAVPAGVLGTLVVLRRNAFTAHALGTGTFPGVVAAAWLGTSAFLGGLSAALAMALLIAWLQRRAEVDAGVATGLVLVGALALGSLLVSRVVQASARFDSILFGSLLGVASEDVWQAAALTAAALLAVAWRWRGLLVGAFDATAARPLGFRPDIDDAVFLAALALAVVGLVDAVGSLLVSAVLVMPAATARLVAKRVLPMIAVSVGLVLSASTAALWVSWHLDTPPGATIAALLAVTFGVVLLVVERRPRRRAVALAGALAALAILAGGCGGSEASGPPTVRVVATTPQVADWVRNVGGERVDVAAILEPGVEAHAFEPSPDDAAAVAGAALVFASGAGFDGWADGLVESAGGSAPLVEVAPVDALVEGAARRQGGEEQAPRDLDPHFWHDPTLVEQAVRTIEASLAEVDPDGAAGYRERAADYRAELRALDAELREALAAVPAARRKMVTDHDAFGYLARRYGIEVIGTVIPSLSTAAEPSAGKTAQLIDTIDAAGVCAVFTESSVDPKLAAQVAQESGARVFPDLYSDTLGPAGTEAGTYLGMMRVNARKLAEGLACTPRG